MAIDVVHVRPAASPPHSVARRGKSISALDGQARRSYALLVAGWIAAVLLFWRFWLVDARVESVALYVTTSIALCYVATVLPSVYLFFVGRMRTPVHVPAPVGHKVAMITLCVPSKEHIAIIEAQIRHMVAVTYPHDSWVLDEENDPRVRQLCARYGIQHFSRRGVPLWNQPRPPFQAKTKAGNVNAWLFKHGIAYEFFVQLDIDHHPVPAYLDRVLGHFTDPGVGWVQAPSVYGNLDRWTARGAAEQELVLQGPLQMGFYGFSRTPFIIGSHSTYRTEAMLAIGGMQPTRAEDHLDTVVLAQAGYTGVYVPEVIATGQGPETFETYLAQQFAWAHSMIQVLFRYAPRYLRGYRPRAALQFLFVQTWYTCWSLSMLWLFLMPSLVLLTSRSVATVPFVAYVLHALPMQVMAMAIWWWSRRWFQPKGLRLSWRGVILTIARWPVVFWALLNVLLRIKRPYMITPKGQEGGMARPFNLRAQGPYLLLVAACLIPVWRFLVFGQQGRAQGYVLFALMGALCMLSVFWVALGLDLTALLKEGITLGQTVARRFLPILLAVFVLAAMGTTFTSALPAMAEAARWNGAGSVAVAHTADALPAAVGGDGGAAADSQPATQIGVPAKNLWNTRPASAAVPAAPPTTDLLLLAQNRRFTGAFDPDGTLLNPSFTAEMIYINLSAPSISGLSGRLQTITSSGRVPVVTLEPWPLTGQGFRADQLLADLSDGRYDPQLREIAQALGSTGGQVVVRFAQEMDIVSLYPWSTDHPADYVQAYRHVHTVLQAAAGRQLLWMWSPAGNANEASYYPGADVVDLVGITVLSSPAFNALVGTSQQQTFAEIMAEKYARARGFSKPVVAAELGVSGTAEVQRAWLQAMWHELPNYPDLRGIIYYNDVNATNALVPNPPDYQLNRVIWDAAVAAQDRAAAYHAQGHGPLGGE
ncbi:MAG: glycosyltransferase family 2 protein [Chloroflexota bacterium]